MSETEKQCAIDKPEISEVAPIFTSHRLGMADAKLSFTAPPRTNAGRQRR